MTETLDLYLDGTHVATIADAGKATGCALTYTSDTVEQHGEGAILLSATLPVSSETYGAYETRHFLNGLLPESHVRARLADLAKVGETDTFGLLRAYGLDCAGAIQFLPPGTADLRDAHVVWLDLDQLDDAVKALPAAPLGVAIEEGVRSSLGGLQGKLPLVVEGGRTGVPAGGMPSTHILKPARLLEGGGQEWPGIVAAESFGLDVIRTCHDLGLALRASEAEPLELKSRPALLVKRFDRTPAVIPDGDESTADGAELDISRGQPVRRIHQEDAAQALGIEEKYQRLADLPPRWVDIAVVLERCATVPAIERQVLVQLMVLNAVLGNCDAHARNVSLQLRDGHVSLAPAYDIVPTCAWPRHDRELALRIGGESMLDDLEREHFLDEAQSWGLRRRAAVRTLDQTLDAAAEALKAVETRTRELDRWEPVLDVALKQALARLTRFAT